MIYIVEYEGYENNEHKLEITGKTVSREEYDDFMKLYGFKDLAKADSQQTFTPRLKSRGN